MSKYVKELLVSDIRSRIGESCNFLVIDSSKLDAVATNKFRLALRDQSISALSVRNSLAKKALNEQGVSSLDPLLEGPSTLVWGSEDIVALSKEISKWARQLEKLEIKGGTAEGKALSAEDVEKLSKIPSRLELIGQIVSLMLSPGATLAGALLGPGGKLASQIKTVSEKAVDDAEVTETK